MTDKENNTDSGQTGHADSTPTSPEKLVDTSPYLNTRHGNDSHNKGGFVMPLVLLAVTAIVIVATFYEDEYKHLVASIEDVETETITRQISEATVPAHGDIQEAIQAESVKAASVEQEISVSNTDTAAESMAEDSVAQSDSIADPSSMIAVSKVDITEQREALYQARLQRHDARQQHNAQVQQRRYELLKQAQARREIREKLMDEYREQMARETQSLKAVYIQAQQQRTADTQKIRQIRDDIDKLHRQLREDMHKLSPGSADTNRI